MMAVQMRARQRDTPVAARRLRKLVIVTGRYTRLLGTVLAAITLFAAPVSTPATARAADDHTIVLTFVRHAQSTRARTRTMALSWYFLSSSGRSPILVDQAVDDLPARDPAGHVDRLAGFM